MTQESTNPEREQKLEQVLAAYLHAQAAGQPPREDELLAQHPDLADELRSFFRNRSAVERVAEPLRQHVDESTTIGPEPGGGSSTTVRYFGDYELLEEIAKGGMGVVYKARQVSLNRLVALKMILRGELATEADVQRFRAEAEAAAKLDHPHIVPIYEVGEHKGQQYFSMKLIDGGSLAQRQMRCQGRGLGSHTQRDAARLLATVARAVHFAHQHGILHRDLKPGNILLSSRCQPSATLHSAPLPKGPTGGAEVLRLHECEPFVTDFGLAKQIKSDTGLTQSGAIVGTPSYMAPEQARAEKALTTACDVYSLGAILYELLTGRPPFRAENVLDTLMHVVERAPERPTVLNQNINRDLETICLKCLEKEPARRYESAQALADDLQRFVEGRPIVARPVGRVERLVKWARRRPAPAALLGVSGVAILVVLGGATYFTSRLAQRNNDLAVALKHAEEETTRANDNAGKAKQERDRADDERRRTLEQLDRAEVLVYAHTLGLAQQAFETGDGPLGLRYLDECQVSRRGWEHRYLSTRYDSKKTLRGHGGPVCAVALTPDGKQVVSGGDDGTVRVWDRDGASVLSMDPHEVELKWGRIVANAVNSVAVSPDGKWVASAYSSGTVRVWDFAKGSEAFTLTGHVGKVRGVAFSPDGKRIASAGDDEGVHRAGEVYVWDIEKQQKIFALKGHTFGVSSLSFSSDGKHLVTGSDDGTAKIWELENGHAVFTLSDEGSDQTQTSVAYSPDGKWVAIANSARGKSCITIWETDKGQKFKTVLWPCVNGVVFAPDGKRIASACVDGSVRVMDLEDGEGSLTLMGHRAAVRCVAFSSDGMHVLSGSDDGTVRIWNAVEGQTPWSLYGGHSVTFTSDGKRVAAAVGQFNAGGGGELRVYDSATGESLSSIKTNGVRGVAISPDGTRIASAHGAHRQDSAGEVKLWDTTNGRELLTIKGHIGGGHSLAFSPDSKRLAVSLDDGSVGIWNLETSKKLIALKGKERVVTRTLAFSSDGKQIAAGRGGWDFAPHAEHPHAEPSLVVWDTETGKAKLELEHLPSVPSVAFSPDGKRLAGAVDSLIVWDVQSGQPFWTSAGQPGDSADSSWVAWSSDGTRVASLDAIGTADNMVTVYDAGTGVRLLRLRPLGDIIKWDLGFSGDGRWLGVVEQEGKLTLWDAAHEHECSTLRACNGNLERVEVSNDARALLSTTLAGTITLWDANTKRNRFSVQTKEGFANTVCAFTSDRKRVALGQNGPDHGQIRILDAETGDEIVGRQFDETVYALAFSHDGKRLAIGRWSSVLADTLFPDADAPGTIWIWDFSSDREPFRLDGDAGSIVKLAFSPDDKRLASGSANGTLKKWDLANGQKLLTVKLDEDGVTSLAWSHDGSRIATTSSPFGPPPLIKSQLKVWDAKNGHELLTVAGNGSWHSIAFSASDERIMAVGSWEDSLNHETHVRSWSSKTGQEQFAFCVPTPSSNGIMVMPAGTVQSEELTPDGKHLVIATLDGTVRVWSLDRIQARQRAQHEK